MVRMNKSKEGKKVSVAVLNVTNKNKKVAMNKDLNGGFGTADSYSGSLFEKIIGLVKRKSIKLPVVSLSFLMGIFKQRNISAKYYEGELPLVECDVILIYGSIVDYAHENFVCKLLKRKFRNAKVGFIGPFPSTKPELFESGDFVLVGDFEHFFLKKFNDVSQLSGNVVVREKVEMDELPSPDLEGFPISQYGYSPAVTQKPFFALQSSRGCPYSCSYYCVYGKFQGAKMNFRSPKKVVRDMLFLRDKYGIRGFQFRDPTFGVKEGYIEEFCNEIRKQGLNVRWGIETRMDLLDEKKIKMMFDAGLRNINIGIETVDPSVAKNNKRLLIGIKHQEGLVRYCERIGVKISAFYIFGYEGDTKESMESVLSYAKKLNTFLARFSVCTPYPGTEFFEGLQKEGRLLTNDYEKYTQFNPVIRQKNLTSKDVQDMVSKAYRQYYFRFAFILRLLKWKIREFWL